jgi:septal ring factor EnvC (AmiA/AmiB activator)
MNIANWFKKWESLGDDVPTEQLFKKLKILEEKYNSLLLDLKRLEQENIETTNSLYELRNSIDAVDARIDILTAENWIKKNV